MNTWIGTLLLLGGAVLCLFAAIGVLRLPDFFMRMHAATKAGVAGSGLVLLGVAAFDGSASTWIKAGLAVLFLLLTTPVAGHLIGRAGYVSGAPLWRGTHEDALQGLLGRASPTPSIAPASAPVRRVVLMLAEGPHADHAIAQAVQLAREQGAELCGMALIDLPRLQNVGPVPIGAGWHAQGMRERRIAQARQGAAGVIQRFEAAARRASLAWSTQLAEGRPSTALRQHCHADDLLLAGADAWFDHGVLDLRPDVAARLGWTGRHPVRVLRGARPA